MNVCINWCDIGSDSAWKGTLRGDRREWYQEISKVHSQGYSSFMAEFLYYKEWKTKCCCFFF